MKLGVKIKERIARTIAEHFTTNEIVNVFTDANITTDKSLYAKWRITLDAFSRVETEEGLFHILEEFCHPLNFTELSFRDAFIEKLNAVLTYENLEIRATDRTAKIVSRDFQEEKEETALLIDPKIQEPRLPDVNASDYSEKVIELVANEFTKALSNWSIRKISEPIVKENPVYTQKNVIGYFEDFFDETPFYTFEDVLQTLRRKDPEAHKTISRIISALLHPLNFDADESKSAKLAEKIGKYLKYDKLHIQEIGDGEYEVFSQEELGEISAPPVSEIEQEEIEKIQDSEKIKQNKELIKKIRDTHQLYMDTIEIFCQNPKKPTADLNDAYLFLSDKIEKMLEKLNLEHYDISLYRPFNTDLYSAEIEWNGSGDEFEIRLGPKLSWDAIRPTLYKVHSDITKILNLSEEDKEMTNEEKRIEEITTLISQKRIQKENGDNKPQEKTMKIEISKMPDLNIKNVDDTNITKGKKKIALPKFSPTAWNKVQIRFIDENNVYITADKKTATADYEGLGFRNDKNGKPNTAWKFLLELSKNNGETPAIKSPIPDTIKNQKRVLSDRLKTIFKNDTDPFDDFSQSKTYKIKIKLIPPTQEPKKDKYGIGDYLDETMTSQYEANE
jgi:hypothetical protein